MKFVAGDGHVHVFEVVLPRAFYHDFVCTQSLVFLFRLLACQLFAVGILQDGETGRFDVSLVTVKDWDRDA